MRTYWYIVIIAVIAALISLNTIKVFSFNDINLLITVLGLIYGITAGFAIGNAQERFSKVRDLIAEETQCLVTLYYLSKELSDKTAALRAKELLIAYCEEVPTLEWHEYKGSEITHEKFRNLIQTIAKIKVKNAKDEVLFQAISSEMSKAADNRSNQLILTQTRMTRTQWALNMFLSAVLIISVAFLSFEKTNVAFFTTACMTIAVLIILLIIYQLDSFKMSTKEVSEEPYYYAANILKKDTSIKNN
jgi:hypothetical protein